MKLQKGAELKIGSKVMTRISPYPGEIVSITIEQDKNSYGNYTSSERPTTIYGVRLPFLVQGEPDHTRKVVQFCDAELQPV